MSICALYHFDSIFLIPVTVFPTRFPHRNSEKRHYETNIIPYLGTLENSWEKLIIRANFSVIWGLTASHDPKIWTQDECLSSHFSKDARMETGTHLTGSSPQITFLQTFRSWFFPWNGRISTPGNKSRSAPEMVSPSSLRLWEKSCTFWNCFPK